MISQYSNRFWKIGKYFIALFVLLFVFRLLYTYYDNKQGDNDEQNSNQYPSGSFFGSINNLRKNYASEKYVVNDAPPSNGVDFSTNQKYEKTAEINLRTSEFDKAEKKIKAQIQQYDAIIQYEQILGGKGHRKAHFLIGVSPNLFDKYYKEILKISSLNDCEVTKIDKTNEYRQLDAKKKTIENALNSLKELKNKNGQISDYVSLNDKILEIEEKAQELGVELGNFNQENEFCTVKLSIYEGNTIKSISFLFRVKISLEWTIKYFAIIIVSVFFMCLAVLIILTILDKIKFLNFPKENKIE